MQVLLAQHYGDSGIFLTTVIGIYTTEGILLSALNRYVDDNDLKPVRPYKHELSHGDYVHLYKQTRATISSWELEPDKLCGYRMEELA